MEGKKDGEGASKVSVYQPEFNLSVSRNLALLSIGFSMDAGSSATKLVYRSKEDYDNGCLKEPSATHGKLRLRFFGGWRANVDKIVEFIRQNCDVQKSDLHEWFQTGAQMVFAIDKLDSTFRIKTKLMSEIDATAACLHEFVKDQTMFQLHPFTLAPVLQALNEVKSNISNFATMFNTEAAAHTPSPGAFDIEAYVKKIVSSDPVSYMEELNSYKVEYPCLYMMCGSATGALILHSNGKYDSGDYNPAAGRTFIGEGRILTGAKDYAELIEMASRGDHTKVDTIAVDLKNTEREEKDWYSGMPDNLLVFHFGKMADEKYDGTYTKDDIANGLLQLHCASLTRFAAKEAKLHKIKSIIFGGSFVTLPLARESLQRWFLTQSLMAPLMGDTAEVTLHILPNPGFVGALGVWHKNLELEKNSKSHDKDSASDSASAITPL